MVPITSTVWLFGMTFVKIVQEQQAIMYVKLACTIPVNCNLSMYIRTCHAYTHTHTHTHSYVISYQ